uniref:O-methyltransferase n=1 Tax=Streptomyces echinatus TaxID=67293 RepID=A1C186_9ACTN|nr:O-methyltransferase [Streptomyces echinatus]
MPTDATTTLENPGGTSPGAASETPPQTALETALIRLADRSDAEVAAGLADLGPDRCARALLRETADRARLFPEPPVATAVEVRLRLGEERSAYTVTLGGGAHEVTLGPAEAARARLTQDLPEFLRAVYGAPGRHDATRELHITEPDRPVLDPADPEHAERAAAVTALHQLAGALARPHRSLNELAVHFRSDKWGGHWYTPHYDRYFAPLRDGVVNLVEIGIGGYDDPDQGGASLRMWKHYFPRGLVHGLDVYEKRGIAEPRLFPLRGDQSDPAYLAGLAAERGPFDIVVDDGSHLNEHVLTSFEALFPHLRPGGLYVVEDTQTAYWTGWGGNDRDLNDPTTSMGFVKALVDGLNHQERTPAQDGPVSPAARWERGIGAVHVHHNLVVVEKSVNTEQGAPAWVPRDVDPRSWYTAPERSE